MHRYLWLFAAGSALGCSYHHHAPLRASELAPPPNAKVTHSSPLWIELEGTPAKQCEQTATELRLCFAEVDEALGRSLERTLWASFPGVRVKRKGDNVAPGDYLLHVRLRLDSRAPDSSGPGWSALARSSWQLVRDGVPLAGQSVSSRSRGDFAYGRGLGAGAGEAVDAIALHIASVVGGLPELRPIAERALPPVAVGRQQGTLVRVSLSPPTKPTAAR